MKTNSQIFKLAIDSKKGGDIWVVTNVYPYEYDFFGEKLIDINIERKPKEFKNPERINGREFFDI